MILFSIFSYLFIYLITYNICLKLVYLQATLKSQEMQKIVMIITKFWFCYIWSEKTRESRTL